MSNMTTLYRNFYTKYRSSYGPDTCILLLVGKFYELYDYIDKITGESLTPIKRVAQLMSLTLKEKPAHGPSGEMGLWSGFPEQSLHKFAYSLTSQGWTVVVVDQVKNSSNEVIDRIPTRVLSPGTHVETAGQDRLSVAALCVKGGSYSAAVNDLTTGEVLTFTTKEADEILHMFQVYSVKEVVVEGECECKGLPFRCTTHSVKPIIISHLAAQEYIRKMFKVKSLLPVETSLGLSPDLICALIQLLRFIEDHFPQQAERLTSHKQYMPENHMCLSNNILEQLNILASQKSVLSLLDNTYSSIGKRALRERILRPITDGRELLKRWSQIEFINTLGKPERRIIERDLKALYDLPRLHFLLASGTITETGVLQLFQTYSATTCLIENLRGTVLSMTHTLESEIKAFRKLFSAVFDESKAQLRSDDHPVGFISALYAPLTHAEEVKVQHIQEGWDLTLKGIAARLGLSPDDFTVKYDSEYVLEVPRSQLKNIQKEDKIQIESKKSGPLRVICPEFTAYSDALQMGVRRINAALAKELHIACDVLWEGVKGIQDAWVDWLGAVDCSLSLAHAAREYDWCKPSLGDQLEIKGLRHPLLESQQTREAYVKHDVSLGPSKAGWLIYGVNASGKSSLMKATGIAAILAQAGSYVPATSMTIRPYDAAFSRIWNHDNIWAGLSSFAVEVSELSEILKLATSRSLVLGDEVCSGTESYSATALVAATLEHLDARGTHFMFATHLHDLLKVPGFQRPSISVWHLRVIRTPENKLIYDRTLQPGSGSAMYGLEVAKAMGLPHELMSRAYEIRRGLEGTVTADKAPKSDWNSQIQRKACEVCGSPVVRDLEVHHIDSRANGGGNHARNLAVLCESCHDAHHSGELDIPPLTQTSEGLERFSYNGPLTIAKAKAKVNPWTVEEMETIKATVNRLKGRPAVRIATELQEVHGILITTPQIKRFI
jgi:DNA mismatch repair protein MutS